MSGAEQAPFALDDPDGYLRIGVYKLERFANAEAVQPEPAPGHLPDTLSLRQRKREVAPLLGGVIPLIDMPPLVTTEETALMNAFESDFSQ